MYEKKNYISILRILAIFMVFNFHIIIILDRQGLLFKFANGGWGNVGTSLFFLISGNCLARNYGKEMKLTKFYIKRWLAIFPAFYICYLLAYFFHTVILQNDALVKIPLRHIFYTLIGIDNYLNFFNTPHSALVGEWYTAVIVFIYLLFPILQFLYRKSKLIGSVLIVALYILNLYFTWGIVPDDAHPITGITIFWIGMMLYHLEEKLENMPWFVWCIVLFLGIGLFFIPLSGSRTLYTNAMALFIFLLFMRLGTLLSPKGEPRIIGFLSKIEYGIYLCHHSVMYILVNNYITDLGGLNPILYYIVCLLVTIVLATLITYLSQWIVNKIKRAL